MIIAKNSIPHISEFNSLLNDTLDELNRTAKKSAKKVSSLTGNKLEPFVRDIMAEKAIGSVFEDAIECTRGQAFPDIIAKKYYGIEVKSTTQNHWRTTGNSVLESTRIAGIERIFMLFGKLGKPIEFRCRPYDECLSEVIVTHSPRYLVDMNLGPGATIFDKMKTSYEELRNQSNPIKSVVNYYKSRLKPGEDVWWIGKDGLAQANNFIIKIWNNLTSDEKLELKVKALTFFPELLSNSNDKFGRLAIWLITKEGVVCPNVRDLFTAGGKSDLLIGGKTYKNVPRIFVTLIQNLPDIAKIIFKTKATELSAYWQKNATEGNKDKTWIRLVAREASSINGAKHLDLEEMINRTLAG